MNTIPHTLFSRGPQRDRRLYAEASTVFGKERIPKEFYVDFAGDRMRARFSRYKRDEVGDVEWFEFKTGGFVLVLFND